MLGDVLPANIWGASDLRFSSARGGTLLERANTRMCSEPWRTPLLVETLICIYSYGLCKSRIGIGIGIDHQDSPPDVDIHATHPGNLLTVFSLQIVRAMSEGSAASPRARARPPMSDRQKLSGERLEKKRETDRESQRAVRNRTKAYIAHLEKLVQTLQESQEDERLAHMTQQCQQLREENQLLKGVLTSITKLTKSVEATLDETKSSPPAFSPPTTIMDASMDSRSPQEGQATRSSGGPSQQRAPWRRHDSFAYSEEGPDQNLTSPLEGHSTITVVAAGDQAHQDPTPPAAETPSLSRETTFQQPPEATIPPEPEPAHEPRKPSHVFEIVNQIIGDAENFKVAALNPVVEVDAAIRAVALGWPAVSERYSLDRGWLVIQQIQQEVFFCCGPVERLAILRLLRLKLLQHVAETNKEEFASQLPSFMTPRPIQRLVPHQPLVDYFAWPELRELLILKEKAAQAPMSSAETNAGAAVFASSIRISWPFDLSSAWVHNPNTGLFSYSSAFLERFQDIQCWTMCPEFFKICPELSGLIRVHDPARDAPPLLSAAC